MIDTIIFDFGDIFINLDKRATIEGLERLGLSSWNEDLDRLNISFEKGQISRDAFLLGIQKQIPNATIDEIRQILES
jgi:putative hydrolase of the HAD superfamily